MTEIRLSHSGTAEEQTLEIIADVHFPINRSDSDIVLLATAINERQGSCPTMCLR